MASTKPTRINRNNKGALSKVSPDIPEIVIDEIKQDYPLNYETKPPITTATPQRINEGDPLHDEMRKEWLKHGRPRTMTYGSNMYLIVNDSGLVFVLKGAIPASEDMYGRTSM